MIYMLWLLLLSAVGLMVYDRYAPRGTRSLEDETYRSLESLGERAVEYHRRACDSETALFKLYLAIALEYKKKDKSAYDEAILETRKVLGACPDIVESFQEIQRRILATRESAQ